MQMMALKTRQEMATLAQLIPQEKGYFIKISLYSFTCNMQRNLLFKFLSGIVQTFSDKLLNKGSLIIMIIETLFIAIFFLYAIFQQ